MAEKVADGDLDISATKTVPEGAATFRNIEQRARRHHRDERNVVLATGGGVGTRISMR